MTRNPTSATGAGSASGTRNPGVPFEAAWIRSLSLSSERVESRVVALERWDGPERAERIPRLHQVLRSIDLTTLAGDDTEARVAELCRTARTPLPRALRSRLGLSPTESRVRAVCVHPVFVPGALKLLQGSGVAVATVAAGFPHGLSGLSERIAEVRAVGEAGADEIDVVIRREWALTGRWRELYDEIAALRSATGPAHLKVILSTGELHAPSRIARAAITAMMAGADFVKTSTGKERVNATLGAGVAMARAIRRYRDMTGHAVGLKAAGGIRTPREGLQWLRLVEEELGRDWTDPSRFRIGASGLLDALVEEIRGLSI